jgi:quercetin dioxygenase-like cupin family protein
MDAQTVIKELEEKYPGKRIVCLPESSPSEIICEFDPPEDHPEWSMALAVIDKSQPHFHRKMTEVYSVVRGELKLFVGNEEYTMYEGQSWTILPGQVHWAEGDATWVEVYASPAWCQEDHILATV